MSFAAGWVLLCAAGVFAAEDSHHAPAASYGQDPRAVDSSRQNTLSEMWQRRILDLGVNGWSPDEMSLLLRIRNAEAAGALAMLKSRARTLKGFVVVHKSAGSSESRLRLTKDGFERYLTIKSQAAVDYFDSKDIEAKWAFLLEDLEGRRLFDPKGLLTDAGEGLYNRILGGMEARWKSSSGQIYSNRRPRPAAPAAQPAAAKNSSAEMPPAAKRH